MSIAIKLYKNHGFTLTEMLIILSIISILIAVGTPSMRSYMATRRLSGATRQVMTDMIAARIKSVRLNQVVQVSFPDTNSYRIRNDANNDGSVGSNEGDVVTKSIHPDYYDVTIAAGSEPRFSPNGKARQVDITISRANDSKTVSISIFGHIRIE